MTDPMPKFFELKGWTEGRSERSANSPAPPGGGPPDDINAAARPASRLPAAFAYYPFLPNGFWSDRGGFDPYCAAYGVGVAPPFFFLFHSALGFFFSLLLRI